MNKDQAIIQGLRNLLDAMREHLPDSKTSRILANMLPNGLDESASTWLIEQGRQLTRPLVFSPDELPGYVFVGYEGEEPRPIPAPDPMLEGLLHARSVFLNGINAPMVLERRNPNATRNALKRAADWMETEARFAPMAIALRAIRVNKDGACTYVGRQPVRVGYVFSACANRWARE